MTASVPPCPFVRLPAHASPPICGRRSGQRLTASRRRRSCAPSFAGPYYLCRQAGRLSYVPAEHIAHYALSDIVAGPFRLGGR